MARAPNWGTIRTRRKAREEKIREDAIAEVMKTPKYTGIPRGASKIEKYGNMVTKLTAIYTEDGTRIPLPLETETKKKAVNFLIWRSKYAP